MYVARVACCPLVSHVEYVPRDLLKLKKSGQTDRWTDGHNPVTLRFPLDATSARYDTIQYILRALKS